MGGLTTEMCRRNGWWLKNAWKPSVVGSFSGPSQLLVSKAIRDPLQMADSVQVLAEGGPVYGQRVPVTFGGPFTWAGQRYVERSVSASTQFLLEGNASIGVH